MKINFTKLNVSNDTSTLDVDFGNGFNPIPISTIRENGNSIDIPEGTNLSEIKIKGKTSFLKDLDYLKSTFISKDNLIKLYAFCGINDSYPYWSTKEVLEVGDIIAGSDYEQQSLNNVYVVNDIKTVSELKETLSGLDGYNDDSIAYLIDKDNQNDPNSWKILASDSPSFSGSTSIDFSTKQNIINEISLIEKTWNGLDNFDGYAVWTDGTNYYYSRGSSQYVLENDEWKPKTWNGLTSFYGQQIWTDGTNIYYSNGGGNQYILDKATSTWQLKTWTSISEANLDFLYGMYVWTDGENTYFSAGTNIQYVFNKTTVEWEQKTWNGLTDFDGSHIWSDGTNVYNSKGTEQSILENGEWKPKIWNGLLSLDSAYIWTDGINIYYSNSVYNQCILENDEWVAKNWNVDGINASGIWSDGNNIYYSAGSQQYQFTNIEEGGELFELGINVHCKFLKNEKKHTNND